jgi:cysteinyl-tRNA synthetase
LAGVLGLLQADPEQFLQAGIKANAGVDEATIVELIAQRKAAKANKHWAQADQLRDQLKAMGIALEDVAGGETLWRREG